ncbi:protein XRI1-like isoform X2 [Andrographis paniculata]|nr:protein XRI1-like isoform X2 [Andrographis paniculata]
MLGAPATPAKCCGDLPYGVTRNDVSRKEFDEIRKPPSKKRRMLNFEPEIGDVDLLNDESLLGSKETLFCLEDGLSEMSQWVAGFSEDISAPADDFFDSLPESWIDDCLNDLEIPDIENISSDGCASGASDAQIDVTDLSGNAPPEHDTEVLQNESVQTPRKIVIKGPKNFTPGPRKLATSLIVYPFTIIKPCNGLGVTTLKDINEQINAPTPNHYKDGRESGEAYPKSAFSGKPVVGKTKIRTEGGKGSITIVRTKG